MQCVPPACILHIQSFGRVQVVDLETRLCHAEAKLVQSVADSQAESQAQLVALQLARADQAANQELCQRAELQQAQLLTQLQTCQVGPFTSCACLLRQCASPVVHVVQEEIACAAAGFGSLGPLSCWTCGFLNPSNVPCLKRGSHAPCSAS